MKICPYIGLINDSKTPAIYPTEHNLCYRVNPALSVTIKHQHTHCLSASHLECPVFYDPETISQAEFLSVSNGLKRDSGMTPYVLVFVIVIGLALSIWLFRDVLFSNQQSSQMLTLAPIATPIQEPVTEFATATVASSPVATINVSLTATLAPTFTPMTPTETASITPPPGLGTPIGANPGFIVHRVSSGESLTTIAGLYGTSETAIRSVNLLLPLPLWENWLLVVPYQADDVADFPLFEIYQVTVDGVTVATLAQQFNVDAALLAQYNQLKEDGYFANGQWVLIPHTRR